MVERGGTGGDVNVSRGPPKHGVAHPASSYVRQVPCVLQPAWPVDAGRTDMLTQILLELSLHHTSL